MISGQGGHFPFCGVLVCYIDTINERRMEEIKLESYLGRKLGGILAIDEEILILHNAKWGATGGFHSEVSFS